MSAQAPGPAVDVDAAVNIAVGAITSAARQAIEDLVATLGVDALANQLAAVTGELDALKAKRVTELADLETLTQELQAKIDADQGDPPTT